VGGRGTESRRKRHAATKRWGNDKSPADKMQEEGRKKKRATEQKGERQTLLGRGFLTYD